jgi:hypothetical protein
MLCDNAITMLVFLLKWLIFDHTPKCLKMVVRLLQPPLLFLCNVSLLFDDVVIEFRTICYIHLYWTKMNIILCNYFFHEPPLSHCVGKSYLILSLSYCYIITK